jgi:hypothetical protein
MFLFETILFYKRVPSYYKIYKQSKGYFFEAVPLEYYKDTAFPNFFAEKINEEWKVNGTDSEQLIKQAIEDLEKFSERNIQILEATTSY